MTGKGEYLEELVRWYYYEQGFYALRSVDYTVDEEKITDIDVWLYARQSAGVRIRVLVDCKNRSSGAKAPERILWVKGLQHAFGADRGVVATTADKPSIARLAREQNITLLPKRILDALEKRFAADERLTWEEFTAVVRQNRDDKSEKWVVSLDRAKAAVASAPGFAAFNACLTAFNFFASKIETQVRHRERLLRCAYFSASLACIALDAAIAPVTFNDPIDRHVEIERGVTYGNESARESIGFVLSVVSDYMDNGRAIAQQIKDALNKLFENVRSEVIAEYFSKEPNAAVLFQVARELDKCAFTRKPEDVTKLSADAKSVLGVFADFIRADRKSMFAPLPPQSTADVKQMPTSTDSASEQPKLI